MDKKRVLHVLVSNRFSGAENVACQIIHLFSRDKTVEMAYCSPDGQIRQALAERKVEFIPLQAATLVEVKRAIKTYRPTLIHAHDMRASFLVALACGKIPYISHIHNNAFASRKLTVKAILYRVAAIKARHVFWVSKAAAEGYYFKESLEEKSSVLHNIVDVKQLRERAAHAEQQDSYDVVFLGRMTEAKNPHRLVEVLQQVIEKRPETTAAIIGTGELEQEIKEKLECCGMTENVKFLGFMSNPYGILQNAKVMLMTSRWEGLPMCALEALALGIPIVSTPTDGLCELVMSGETGYLSDQDEELVQRIEQITSDPELQRALSQKSKEAMEIRMDLKAYKRALLAAYGLNG